MMTLSYQMTQEGALELSREYQRCSPTHRKCRRCVQLIVPGLMLLLWVVNLGISGFDLTGTLVAFGFSLLWYGFYPRRYDANVRKSTLKLIQEAGYAKNFGPSELQISEQGLHSKSPTGESSFAWSAVDRVHLSESYLFLFVNGLQGFPIPIAEISRTKALAAHAYVVERMHNRGVDPSVPVA